MTREEAIKILQGAIKKPNTKDGYLGQALNMAIKALEQEPCDDVVSRRAAIEIARSNIHYGLDKEYEYSRELLEKTMAEINSLPPITPQPKTGHWKWVQYDYNHKLGNWHCSECKCVVVECVYKNEKSGIPLYKYCPQCGCRMVEPKERSE